jgi:dipeptidyl aminopeptidase/acylaminoacyl peptidase
MRLTALGLRPGNLSWRPDGQQILFTADEAVLDPLLYGRSDLFTVDLEGEVTRLTDDGFTYSSVAYAPDGGSISYVRAWGTDYIIERRLDHGGPRDLYVRPVDGGEPLNLTADFDLDPSAPIWSPDSRHLYFTAGIGGATHLFRVGADGGAIEQVTTGERRIRSLTIDDDFERMTYLVGLFDAPSEVWSADIDGGNERRLTNVYDAFLGEVALSRAETVRWQSFDGTPIEGFLIHPHGYDPDAPDAESWPLIIVNHGGPHSASGYGFNFKNQYFAARGYFVFLPNFRSSTGYGDDFKWATWGGWGTLDGEDVLAGVDHLIERYPIDRDRVGTTGHSYGGILTNWLITRYPDRFAAAVSGAGASNWTSNYAHSDVARTKELEFFGRPWEPEAREIMIRQSAYLNSGGVRTPTLFVHGEVDYRVPLEGAIQLYTSLKKQRVPAELIVYDGMAHGIRGHWNNVHRIMNEMRWWETWLKPQRGALTSDGG